MMTGFAEIWGRRLVTIRTLKNLISVKPSDARPIRLEPYHEGPKSRKLEKKEIDKIVSINVAEPQKSEWASPIVSETKNTVQFVFVEINALLLSSASVIRT